MLASGLVPRNVGARGIHQAGDGSLVNGSRHGSVETSFNRPVKPTKAPTGGFFNGPVHRLYLSVTEPDAFIAELTR